jgi:Transposase DDE domain group 1
MILENLRTYKLGTTDEAVTSFAGLPLFLQMGLSLGLQGKLDGLNVKERERGYQPSRMIFSLMGLIQSGGTTLDELDVLRGDEGMKALLGEIPAPNTAGDFLRKYEHRDIYEMGVMGLETAVKVIRQMKLKKITLDIDAFTIESKKSIATMNYEGEIGFTPVMVTCAEVKMPMVGLWRNGNASPMAHLAWLLKRVMKALPDVAITVRSDSAGYQAKVVKVCEKRGAAFTITARKDDAVMETIQSIPKKAWKRYEHGGWNDRYTEMAETVHAFGDKDTKAHRLIVIRWRKKGAELFEWEYHAVLTSLNWSRGLVLQFHRNRQDGSENMNKEMVYGFGLEKLPCMEMKANAAYFQISLLAAIVASAVKHLALPQSWSSFTMKTLRFRLIRLAGYVAQHARYAWMKIPLRYTYREVFEEARWRIIGLEAEFARL